MIYMFLDFYSNMKLLVAAALLVAVTAKGNNLCFLSPVLSYKSLIILRLQRQAWENKMDLAK